MSLYDKYPYVMKEKLWQRYVAESRQNTHIRMIFRDFPGGSVVKNLPYNAGDTGSIPGQGTGIPHAAGQLGPRATTTELTPQLGPACHKLQSPHTPEPAHHNYRAHTPWSLHATTREEKTRTPQLERSLHITMKIPCAAAKT